MKQSRVVRKLACGVAAMVALVLTTAMLARSGADGSGLSPAAAATRESPQISRGRYVVKIAGCNDCHTPGYTQSAGAIPESKWLVGDRLGWQGPWGTTYPVNLRRLMQDMTEAQWLEIARRPMRPPMPWFALRDMSDEDLAAIYHFTRSLGAAGPAAPQFVPPGQPVSTPVVVMPSEPGVTNAK